MGEADSDLNRAIRRAGLDVLDDRGLLPLEEARRIVQGAHQVRRSRESAAEGAGVEQVWAALLSLEDAREFVRCARRLEWSEDPRGEESAACAERYGAGMLPWVADHVAEDGGFRNAPSSLRACLLALGGRRAFSLLLRIRTVDGDAGQALILIKQWITRHPRLGYPLLAERARDGDRRARMLLRHLANRHPEGVRRRIEPTLGKEATDALFRSACVVTDLTESAVLSVLDLAAERELETDAAPWPLFHVQGAAEVSLCHGLCVVAVRARSGNAWGIVLERITGNSPESGRIEVYRYGSAVRPGLSPRHARPLSVPVAREGAGEGGDTAAAGRRPRGKRRAKARGGGMGDAGATDWVGQLRRHLRHHPGAFWIDPRAAAAALELAEPHDVIVATDQFTHVLGTDAHDVPASDKFWLARPSDTRVYRSLARAIVERDPGLFRPGKSNLEL
ncbi:MAG: hypothetical protein JXQ29_09610 [Planctomycetes bacterium]|nr:hypothetical protein [Planctomycetota bacterium]